MANVLTLTITAASINNIGIHVTGRTSSTAIDASIVKMKRSNNSAAFTDFTPTIAGGATVTDAVIDFTGVTPAVDTTDIFLIQIIDGSELSDRSAVDLATAFVAHTATVSYVLPSQAGTYTLALEQLNGTAFAKDGSVFTAGLSPDTAHSSISIDKPYLVKYTGQTCNVTMVLNNATGDAANGDYEVVYNTRLS